MDSLLLRQISLLQGRLTRVFEFDRTEVDDDLRVPQIPCLASSVHSSEILLFYPMLLLIFVDLLG